MPQPIPDTMQATVLMELGSFDHLATMQLPTPLPTADEVLIRVATVAANRQDINLAMGHFKVPGLSLPHVLGLDPAGVVAAVGADVTDLHVADRVVVKPPIACTTCGPCLDGEDDACERISSLGIHRPGGMAAYVSVPQRNVFAIPDGLGFAEASAIAHSFPVALTLLRRVGVRAGERVLVSGASGAIGSATVQLARTIGAEVVAMVGRAEGAVWLQALPRGLRPNQIIDYQAEPAFAPTVAQAHPQGIDVYVDTASDPQVWTEALKTLARRARVAVIGAHAGPMVQTNNNWLFRQRVSIIGCSGSTLGAFADIIEMTGDGEIQPHIDAVIPMADVGAAYRRLMTRQNHGKIVLRVADDVA